MSIEDYLSELGVTNNSQPTGLPWTVDSYVSALGKPINRIMDVNNKEIAQGSDRHNLLCVVAAINGAFEPQAIENIVRKYRASLDYAHESTEKVRHHFLEELAANSRLVERKNKKIKALELRLQELEEREK